MDARFWVKAFRSLVRHSRDKEFLGQVLTAGLRADAAPKAVTVNFMKSYPSAKHQTVPLGDVRFRLWNMDPFEQFTLGALAGLRQPRRIFEIGTFDGSTTLLLARMVPAAQIYTLDLPPEHTDGVNDRALARVDGAGSRFRDRPEAERITQLYAESRRFDFGPYRGDMDMVVVDGSHDSECVTPDTANALRMVTSDGVVVWDDYTPRWPDVIAAVDDAAARHGLVVVRLANTELALYDATRPKAEDYVARKRAGSTRPADRSAVESPERVDG
jgi:predicted O-methyltransferase YrrM